MARARPARSSPPHGSPSSTASTTARLEAIRSEVDSRLEALEQEALAAPFPEPVARAEFAGQT